MNKLKVYKFIVNRKRKMTQGAELGASHSNFAFQQNEDMCIREIQHKFKRLGHQIFLITIDRFDKDSKMTSRKATSGHVIFLCSPSWRIYFFKRQCDADTKAFLT